MLAGQVAIAVVAIYDDRLEITSVGGLPFGLTAEELLRPPTSRLWNPVIAGVFYRRGITEARGSGTLKMAELNQAAGLQPPEFEARAGEVTVRFWPARIATPVRTERDLSPLQQDLLALLGREGRSLRRPSSPPSRRREPRAHSGRTLRSCASGDW